MKSWLGSILFSCLGVMISTLCALVLARLYHGTQWKTIGPLLFAIALVILASHFGAVISVAGSISGAAVFAFFLYNPENSFQVRNETERSILAWMILSSVALSYLLYPTQTVRSRVRSYSKLAEADLRARLGLDDESDGDAAEPSALANGREVRTGREVGDDPNGGKGRG